MRQERRRVGIPLDGINLERCTYSTSFEKKEDASRKLGESHVDRLGGLRFGGRNEGEKRGLCVSGAATWK